MLIRIRGGSGGISDYLVEGKKSGRFHSREELDQRLTFHGNIEGLDAVLDSFDPEGKTQKYFHISLSFKEEYIDEEILKSIDNAFREFIFSACAEGEFYYYSEAHLPKIKSLPDTQGKYYKRFPHIHVVIPEFNLYSGKRDNPLGLVEKSKIYIDAFQEFINAKYGLESPKDNARNIQTGREAILSRYELHPDWTSQQIKEKIFSLIRGHPEISTVEELAEVVKAFGEVRLRDSEKFGQKYINIKPKGKSKGINLKDPVFLSEYLANRDAQTAYDYTQPDRAHLLEAWRDYAAFAARFLDKASRCEREAYKGMNLSEQKAWLRERWQRHLETIGFSPEPAHPMPSQNLGQEYDLVTYTHLEAIAHFEDWPHIEELPLVEKVASLEALGNFIDNEEEKAIESSGTTKRDSTFHLHDVPVRGSYGNRGTGEPAFSPDFLHGATRHDLVGDEKIPVEELYAPRNARAGSSVSPRFLEAIEQRQEAPSWSKLIHEIDARGFLNYLSFHFGLDTLGLGIEKNASGQERIVAEGRKYSVSDFLTKRMHCSWPEAKTLLHKVAAEQKVGTQQSQSLTSRILWQRFLHYEAQGRKWSDIQKSYREQRQKIREHYRHCDDPQLRPGENAAKRRLFALQKQAELRQLQEEYQKARAYFFRRPHERYRDYLFAEAEKGNTAALGELNRIYPLRSVEDDLLEIVLKKRQQPHQAFMPVDMGYRVKLRRNGSLEYQDERQYVVMVDTYRSIKVLERSTDVLIQALELAKLRYGVKGFEIRNAREEDLAKIQEAALHTGTAIALVAEPPSQTRRHGHER